LRIHALSAYYGVEKRHVMGTNARTIGFICGEIVVREPRVRSFDYAVLCFTPASI
jgi:hypothetical protein